ncbi:MAG TPA: hypothetical protein VME86_17040 [Acidobacteriaceae bacterium]|nr:hypothetical protein [Acidobacteriaceae bacterium]
MAILTIMEGILGKLAADEIKAWLPILSQKILHFAVLRLPEEQRKRYVEEWEAHLMEIPGDLSKVAYSVDQVRAALRMAAIHQACSRPSMMQKIRRYIASHERDSASRVNMTIVWFVWLSLADLAGCKAGDRFTFARHARYPQLYQMVQLGPESGECPLWLSCLVTMSLSLHNLSWRWLQSANRKLLE